MARFTRFDGSLIPPNLAPNALLALSQTILRKGLGVYPKKPWIPFPAIRALDKLIQPDWRILEIGSGMSSIWLAKRAASVTSIESDETWVSRLRAIATREGISNLDIKFLWRQDEMCDFSGITDGTLDLLYVDGGPRGSCLVDGFQKVKTGGYIYCDNWESREFYTESKDAYAFVADHQSELEQVAYFDDYAPAHFGLTTGALFRKVS